MLLRHYASGSGGGGDVRSRNPDGRSLIGARSFVCCLIAVVVVCRSDELVSEGFAAARKFAPLCAGAHTDRYTNAVGCLVCVLTNKAFTTHVHTKDTSAATKTATRAPFLDMPLTGNPLSILFVTRNARSLARARVTSHRRQQLARARSQIGFGRNNKTMAHNGHYAHNIDNNNRREPYSVACGQIAR